MKRQTRHPAPVIFNDPLEHDRIQLEHNLRNSETVIHLSSASDSDAEPCYSDDEIESLEYPRHNSNPTSFAEFPSLDHRARDYLTDDDMHGHGWSHHIGDDYEEGINPYGGESISTAAHHTSAVTLNTGLGGRGARRDLSVSGAEYDPDRPLRDMIAGVDSKLSVFESDISPSRRIVTNNITSDPLVAEDTAELDQILETGHTRPSMHSRSVRVASPVTSGSSSHSESDHGHPVNNSPLESRPKLSDALRGVTLSPKRPRSSQVTRSVSLSPMQRATSSSHANRRNNIPHVPTPRPARRSSIFPSYTPSPQQPDLRLQPPTPSSTSSQFTRMARGLAKEIEGERGQLKSRTPKIERSYSAPTPVSSNPFQERSNSGLPSDKANTTRSSAKNRSRIHLPDVTGLTNAIESPEKQGMEHYVYYPESKIGETENRILQTLNAVQKKLQRLEEENSISRRRVRELEMELEDCKREVAQERTRLIEQESLSGHQHISFQNKKGKARASHFSADTSQLHERYKEAVEGKKALEALINSLRVHLTRLTSELSSHRELLAELRKLRDTDSVTLNTEITKLKHEVERLAGEVEVLRTVVEEGLRERRSAKETSLQQEQVHLGDIQTLNPEAGSYAEAESESEEDEDEADEETETEDPEFSPTGDDSRARIADKTMRTDHATQGSSRANDTRGTRFIDSTEFERISAEIEERRSDHSESLDLSQFSQTRSSARSPSLRSRSRADDTVANELSTLARRASSPGHISDEEHEAENQGTDDVLPRARVTTRSPVAQEDVSDTRPNHRQTKEPDAPFPKIRGKHMERLFFSAPEHNAQTCTACNRHRRQPDRHPTSPPWGAHTNRRQARPRHGTNASANEQDDEGFAEGSDGYDRARVRSGGQEQRRERSLADINEVRTIARQEGLPPQTIVARIIRELEDDFTHYKSIYIELADQYKEMDAASNVAKRNTLAQHLREVVDILEQKGDQIASLYDLLSFKDKSHRPGATASGRERTL